MPPGVSCAISGMFVRSQRSDDLRRDHPVQLGGADRHRVAAEAELLERAAAGEEAELARQVDEPPLRVVDLGRAPGRLQLLGDAGQPGSRSAVQVTWHSYHALSVRSAACRPGSASSPSSSASTTRRSASSSTRSASSCARTRRWARASAGWWSRRRAAAPRCCSPAPRRITSARASATRPAGASRCSSRPATSPPSTRGCSRRACASPSRRGRSPTAGWPCSRTSTEPLGPGAG